MPDAHERHLAALVQEHDEQLDEDLDTAPEDVTGGHVCRWVLVDPDDARDLAIDDQLLDDLT